MEKLTLNLKINEADNIIVVQKPMVEAVSRKERILLVKIDVQEYAMNP